MNDLGSKSTDSVVQDVLVVTSGLLKEDAMKFLDFFLLALGRAGWVGEIAEVYAAIKEADERFSDLIDPTIKLDRGLVGWWKFVATEGTTPQDHSGWGNHATAWSGTTAGATYVKSIIGQALSFDGVDDYVDAGNAASFVVNTGSFEVRINPQPIHKFWTRIVEVGEGENRIGFLLQSATTLRLHPVRGGVLLCHLRTPITADSNTWQHIAGTWDSSGAKIYVNGIEVASWVGNAVLTLPTTPLVRIGEFVGGSGWHFNGLIDEVRIYNRALTAEEVLLRYDLTRPENLTGEVYDNKGDNTEKEVHQCES